VAQGVRDRYDGARRNPWNEIECGSNYARSMASWGAVVDLAGFTFDAGRGHIGFHPRVRAGDAFRSFWSSGTAYGTIELKQGQVTLTILGGGLDLSSLGLPMRGSAKSASLNGRQATFDGGDGEIRLRSARLAAGDVLEIKAAGLSVAELPDIHALS
jgi:hypothetical protein